MATLTDEQVERAAKAYESSVKRDGKLWMAESGDGYESRVSALRAAALHLQLLWDEPTTEEMRACGFLSDTSRQGMWEFVKLRNAALQPKPDPRREVVEAAMKDSGVAPPFIKKYAAAILAALDALKESQ